ncbi:NADH-quinone oxidoreductase subunit A [Marinobacterium nitratireducens]|uniref:NADH-quinone oxidoreductase subunit A n=1 Tax=Marinobacterium nitratireducens TaxID=518897 RepID=A0A917Z9X3_9GAMM|nr:NADH-quinone oxidoreductase subunit A [Marinobacterium nitratireducens]GGO78144.1 NADH-quinone oxidoreductase subunit A [Marinobacterium nitratireducens]
MHATEETLWSLALYGLAVLSLVALMLGLSYALGQQRRSRATDEPFESGIVSVGSGRLRLSVAYFVVAILFVIFDLEVVFLYAWAAAFDAVGLAGFVEALIFILVLLAALAYLWREGALDWGPRQRSLERTERER